MGGVLQGCVPALPFLALQDATQIADPVAHPSSVGLLCTAPTLPKLHFCKFYFAILQFQFFAGRVETEVPHDDGFCNPDTPWRQFRLYQHYSFEIRIDTS